MISKQKQRQLLIAWNEIEEVCCDFRDMTDQEIIKCRKTILERTRKALGIMEDFIDEDIFQEIIK